MTSDISTMVRDIEGQVMEEVDGVKEYIKCSREWKDINKDVAKGYHDIAAQELEHAKKLHAMLDTLSPKATPEEKHLIDFMKALNDHHIQVASLTVALDKI